MNTRTIFAITAVAGMAAAASAQDSVSNVAAPQTAGASDALNLYEANQQRVTYVVDGVLFTSSWGNDYNLFNLSKTSNSGTFFENNLGSGNYISRGLIASTFNAEGYALWTTAGQGVHPTFNAEPSIVTPTGASLQFAVGSSDFGGNSAGIVTAIVDIDPANANRLYVERILTANNGASADGDDENSSFGFGAVDAYGNTVFRADDFGLGGTDALVGNNLYRVAAANRTGFNSILGSGATDAGATVEALRNFISVTPDDDPDDGFNPNSLNAPIIIPQDVTGVVGGRAVTTAFGDDLIWDDSTRGLTSQIWDFSTRGNFQYTPGDILGQGGTATGTLSKLAFPNGNDPVDTVILYPVDNNGQQVGNLSSTVDLRLPAVVTDSVDAFTPAGNDGFYQYRSQVPFRGPNATHGVAVLSNGDVLVSAGFQWADDIGGYDPAEEAPLNSGLAIGLLPANGDPVEWTLAGWTGNLGAANVGSAATPGKPIKDGPGGAIVGYQASFFELLNADPEQQSRRGVSMTPAGFDAEGNAYFTSVVWFPSATRPAVKDFEEMDVALLRAVRTTGAGGRIGYELELMFRSADIFTGENSATEFIIDFIGLNDSNSFVSSGFHSGAVRAGGFLNGGATGTPADAENLGGLIMSVGMTYDTDGNGEFDEDTRFAGDNDEGYNGIVYVQPAQAVATCAQGCTDIDRMGTTDIEDLLLVLRDFGLAVDADGNGQSGTQTDVDCTGNVDVEDLLAVLREFGNAAQDSCN